MGVKNEPDGVEQWQYLTFRVGGETYAVGILEVREILPFVGSTAVPMAPPAIRGLINLRGNAVPVVDLAVLFGLAPTQPGRRACVVILDLERSGAAMGILAESVELVIELRPDDVEAVPEIGTHAWSEFLRGMGRVGDSFVPILDLRRLLGSEDLLIRPPSGPAPAQAAGAPAGVGDVGESR
jgi:purine-binding chemotaxis protein CheW